MQVCKDKTEERSDAITKLHEAGQQVAELKEQVAKAEEAARDKTEERSDAITKLPEAGQRVAELKEQVAED